MKRSLMVELQSWRTASNRKPLVLMGARQVGKTYLLREFAEQNYDNLVYLNFDLNKGLASLFSGSLEPKKLMPLIELQTKSEIIPGKTLIFFDEIQECPNALISLKYFNELANDYHICAAGSLLGVKLLNTKGFPVGKINLLYLHPLDFSEFLQANQELQLLEYLDQVTLMTKIPELIHNQLMDYFKIYLITGGMPEAVSVYVRNAAYNFIDIRKIQQEILNAYYLDFSKHAPDTKIMKISQVWNAIPSQLVKENKKFIYSILRHGARAKDFEDAIQWLVEADLICKTYNITTPHLPLSAYANMDIFKLYMFDVGLYSAVANLDPHVLLQGSELFVEFKGSITETYVAQVLHKLNAGNPNRSLFYWTSPGKAEVDFVIQYNTKIYPIEVKSGTSNKQKSLAIYVQKYAPQLAIRVSPQNLHASGNFLNIPFYLLYRIPQLISSF
jgi:predicted AAA+ superfamily ATPase